MMHLPDAALPRSADLALQELQDAIDGVQLYAERVELARRRFEAENRQGNVTFDAIKGTLTSMCGGVRRCMYCEDSRADQVEHFRPKAFYPEFVFVWLNYLYACGYCNSVKRHHFRLLADTGDYFDLKRSRRDPVAEPAIGSVVLLDPRREDPLQYLSLDLVDTFCFVPRHDVGTPEHARAEYTISCLELNDRDALTHVRAQAYGNYRARLREYVALRGTPEAAHLARALVRIHHPTVWSEMKSQSVHLPDLTALFTAAPEALHWQ